MFDDFYNQRHQQQPVVELIAQNREKAKDDCFYEVDFLLRDNNMSLQDFGINPYEERNLEADGDWDLGDGAGNDEDVNRDLLMETSYDKEQQKQAFETNYPLLNQDQKNAFDTFDAAIERNQGGLFFLDAPGGTGKTFVFNTLLSKWRSKGEIAMAVGSSGIGAILLEESRTAHSRFKSPSK